MIEQINCRYESSDENNFEQPAMFWKNVLDAEERSRLVTNIANSLQLAKDFIQVTCISFLFAVGIQLLLCFCAVSLFCISGKSDKEFQSSGRRIWSTFERSFT
jgi:hypothetical protein